MGHQVCYACNKSEVQLNSQLKYLEEITSLWLNNHVKMFSSQLDGQDRRRTVNISNQTILCCEDPSCTLQGVQQKYPWLLPTTCQEHTHISFLAPTPCDNQKISLNIATYFQLGITGLEDIMTIETKGKEVGYLNIGEMHFKLKSVIKKTEIKTKNTKSVKQTNKKIQKPLEESGRVF